MHQQNLERCVYSQITDAELTTLGLPPATPPVTKYVFLRLRPGMAHKAMIEFPAFVMPSPVVIMHATPSAVQCKYGNWGEKPGTVMF
jgi:hypothetical protein